MSLPEEMNRPEPIVNIIGTQIALGPHRRDLLPTYQRWINDFATLRTLGGVPPGPTTFEGEVAWYDHPANNEVRFTIYERETWRAIGTTSLHEIDYRNRTATFGIMIGEPDARGKGYGTEATSLTLDFAFTALGLHNVLLTLAEFNHAGRRVYEKVGFRECGRRRECRWQSGKLWDTIYMECLASEFTSPVLREIFTPDPER
jgi:diamine N-acetyltransferase